MFVGITGRYLLAEVGQRDANIMQYIGECRADPDQYQHYTSKKNIKG